MSFEVGEQSVMKFRKIHEPFINLLMLLTQYTTSSWKQHQSGKGKQGTTVTRPYDTFPQNSHGSSLTCFVEICFPLTLGQQSKYSSSSKGPLNVKVIVLCEYINKLH